MSKEFVTEVSDVTKLAHAIFTGESQLHGKRATYLRSLVAGTQAGLAGKPVLRVAGRPKRPDLDGALKAFERTNEAFYGAVVAALPEGLTPEERQSKTSFARSSAATLRRALKAGWNPLGEACTAVSKGRLAAFAKEHYQGNPPSVKALEGRVMRYTGRIAQMVDALPKEEASRVLATVLADLGATVPETPALRNVSVRRTPLRPVPH